MKDFEKYVGTLIKFGNSLGFTIGKNNVLFSGLKEGDMLEVYYRKKEDSKNVKRG